MTPTCNCEISLTNSCSSKHEYNNKTSIRSKSNPNRSILLDTDKAIKCKIEIIT